ncbi:MAG: aminodeoxychorismate/anthranilate synthase component II [Thermoplasmata archaeon]|nr:aminodeoxychorismate/anthranilate synthase component II [Thermoplasmata archaeon]
MRILLVDNYDSFVYNIAQYLGEMGADVDVERNDSDRIDELADAADGFVISPGPGHPRSTRKSLDILNQDGFGKPILGVCLGHQAIAHVHGGSVIRADQVVHGKVSRITHIEDPLFEGIPQSFTATRYHSLLVDRATMPDSLAVLAETERGEIMSLRVKGKLVYGVQFHPESIMTSHGKRLLHNFARMCER